MTVPLRAPALAMRTAVRFGVAVSVSRIMPVLYSPPMAITARATIVTCPR